jgi:hypothetical protein
MLVCGGLAETALARPEDDLKLQAQGQSVRGPTSRPAIELRGNLLSVRLHNIPWEAVLKEIQHHTGIILDVQGRIAGTLTQEFEDLPLEKGLRILFRETNFALFYVVSTTEGAAAAALTRIWLFPKGSMTADEGLSHRAGAGSVGEPQDERGSPGEMAATTPPEEEGELAEELVTALDQEPPLEALHLSIPSGNEAELGQPISHFKHGMRAMTLELFAAHNPQEATTLFVSALKNADPEGRLQALDFLHQSGQADETIVLSALGEALKDKDVAVKGFAIQALAERGGPGAIEPLRQALHHPDPSIRMMVLASIAHSGQGRSLLEEAVLDADSEVRSFATFWLEQAVAEGR